MAKVNWSSPKILLPMPFLAVALIFPFIPGIANTYIVHVACQTLFFASLGLAWNIIGGYGGQISLAHAAFFGLGAYTSTWLTIATGISPWIGCFVGATVAMLSCLIISYPTFRLRGPFFSLCSIAFVEILRILFTLYGPGLSVGLSPPYRGVNGDPFYMQFGIALGKTPWYYIFLATFLIIALILTTRFARSKLSYQLMAIREEQDAAESLGINSSRVKLKAMMISTFITGFLGTLYVNFFYFIDPDTVFNTTLSSLIAAVAIIGGLASIWGPLIGAAFLVPIDLYTNVYLGGTYSGVNLLVYGLFIMIAVRFFPMGFISYFRQAWQKLTSRLEKR